MVDVHTVDEQVEAFLADFAALRGDPDFLDRAATALESDDSLKGTEAQAAIAEELHRRAAEIRGWAWRDCSISALDLRAA